VLQSPVLLSSGDETGAFGMQGFLRFVFMRWKCVCKKQNDVGREPQNLLACLGLFAGHKMVEIIQQDRVFSQP